MEDHSGPSASTLAVVAADVLIALALFAFGISTPVYALCFLGIGFLALAPISFRYPIAPRGAEGGFIRKRATATPVDIAYLIIAIVMFATALAMFFSNW